MLLACPQRILSEFPLQQGLLLSVAEWEPSVLTARCFSLLGLEVIQWQVPPGSQVSPSSLAEVDPHIGGVRISEGAIICGR